MNNASLCLSFYWNKPSICFVRSWLQRHLIWNYFVWEKLPVLTSGKNFPPCKWAAQVSLRLCDLQHKTHRKICIPEEIKNLGKPSPAAPILSPDRVFSSWKQAEGRELSAWEQVNLIWPRRSESQNFTWNCFKYQSNEIFEQNSTERKRNREPKELWKVEWAGCERGWAGGVGPVLSARHQHISLLAGRGFNCFDHSSPRGQSRENFTSPENPFCSFFPWHTLINEGNICSPAFCRANISIYIDDRYKITEMGLTKETIFIWAISVG